MNTFRLQSSRSDVAIEFSDVDGDCFRIAVAARDYSAARRVYAYTNANGIVLLFDEAARNWQGWDGCKIWESLERELRLELSTDRLGHIALRVHIRSDAGRPDPWEHDAELTIEAGQLEAIACSVKRLWSKDTAA